MTRVPAPRLIGIVAVSRRRAQAKSDGRPIDPKPTLASSTWDWALARLGNVLGDGSQANVEALRGAAQHLEGLISSDAMAFHQDALTLAYDVAVGPADLYLAAAERSYLRQRRVT